MACLTDWNLALSVFITSSRLATLPPTRLLRRRRTESSSVAWNPPNVPVQKRTTRRSGSSPTRILEMSATGRNHLNLLLLSRTIAFGRMTSCRLSLVPPLAFCSKHSKNNADDGKVFT